MKTIGMIGGMGWESTVTYYRIVNTMATETLGGLHSARCIVYSVDFHEIEAAQSRGDWRNVAETVTAAARALEAAGADFIVICTNTAHKVADEVSAGIGIPLLHIAEVTADALHKKNIRTAGLLGTIYTMEQDFYHAKLRERGITTLIPEAEDRALINRVIFGELEQGVITAAAKALLLRMVNQLTAMGAEGVILGCTELGLLLTQADTETLLFDTAVIHAESAARFALSI